MRAAQDFVGIYRWALDDLAHRLDEATFGFFVRLLAEASYKTGYASGSIRAFAETFRLHRSTVDRHFRVLTEAGEIRVDPARNRYKRGGVAILRYTEYVHASGAQKSSGTGSGTGSGTQSAPLERADQHKRRNKRSEKTQDSALSSHSVHSLAIARTSSRESENHQNEKPGRRTPALATTKTVAKEEPRSEEEKLARLREWVREHGTDADKQALREGRFG